MQQWPQDWKRSVFIPIPKKGNAKECSNYRTTVLISHASKIMLALLSKFFKPGFNSTRTKNFQMLKLDLEKAEEPEIKLPASIGLQKKQENSRKTRTSSLLITPKPLTVWIITNCEKFLKRWEYQTTCLLRNLYAGQEPTVRARHGTMDWFEIGKEVRQGYILSPCLFNIYSEYIMQNAGLDEAQLESRWQGKISITSHMQMTPSLWQKAKKN